MSKKFFFKCLNVLLITFLMNSLLLSVASATELRAGSKYPEVGKGPDIHMPQRPQPKPAPEPPPEPLPKPFPDVPPCIDREPVVFIPGEGFVVIVEKVCMIKYIESFLK